MDAGAPSIRCTVDRKGAFLPLGEEFGELTIVHADVAARGASDKGMGAGEGRNNEAALAIFCCDKVLASLLGPIADSIPSASFLLTGDL
jgi:hypothetical protein